MKFRLETLTVDGENCAVLVGENDEGIASAACFKFEEKGVLRITEEVMPNDGPTASTTIRPVAVTGPGITERKRVISRNAFLTVSGPRTGGSMTSNWKDEVLKKFDLVFIQRFHGDGTILPPPCDLCLKSRAIGLWSDKNKKGYALCTTCSIGAEPIIPGITYRPTEFQKVQ